MFRIQTNFHYSQEEGITVPDDELIATYELYGDLFQIIGYIGKDNIIITINHLYQLGDVIKATKLRSISVSRYEDYGSSSRSYNAFKQYIIKKLDIMLDDIDSSFGTRFPQAFQHLDMFEFINIIIKRHKQKYYH